MPGPTRCALFAGVTRSPRELPTFIFMERELEPPLCRKTEGSAESCSMRHIRAPLAAAFRSKRNLRPNPRTALLLAHRPRPPSPLYEGAFFFRVKLPYLRNKKGRPNPRAAFSFSPYRELYTAISYFIQSKLDKPSKV